MFSIVDLGIDKYDDASALIIQAGTMYLTIYRHVEVYSVHHLRSQPIM